VVGELFVLNGVAKENLSVGCWLSVGLLCAFVALVSGLMFDAAGDLLAGMGMLRSVAMAIILSSGCGFNML
jgi:hypothetical protein